MGGYRLPSQEHNMQPPHPQASSAHPYQQQQQQQQHQYRYQQPLQPVSSVSGVSTGAISTSISSSGAAAALPSYHHPYFSPPPPPQHQHQQATASARHQPPPPVSDLPQSRLAHTQRAMQETGTPSWGFVVYRGAYGDDAAWQRYLAHLKHEVAQAADSSPSGTSLSSAANSGGGGGGGGGGDVQPQPQPPSQSLEWTVVENQATLENASLEAVRQDFAAWVASGGYYIDRPGNPPRLTHCVYVDQKCLDMLAPFENWIRLDRHGPIQFLACILIDGQVAVDEQAAVTGQGYSGWMYANVGSLPELYETLGQMHLWDPGNDVYCMPPWIYPGLRKMKR